MLTAKDKAKLKSLQKTEQRIDQVMRFQKRNDNRGTALISFQGWDPDRGQAYGETLGNGVVYFDLETNNMPAVGELIEVAIANGALAGKGDKKPVR